MSRSPIDARSSTPDGPETDQNQLEQDPCRQHGVAERLGHGAGLGEEEVGAGVVDVGQLARQSAIVSIVPVADG